MPKETTIFPPLMFITWNSHRDLSLLVSSKKKKKKKPENEYRFIFFKINFSFCIRWIMEQIFNTHSYYNLLKSINKIALSSKIARDFICRTNISVSAQKKVRETLCHKDEWGTHGRSWSTSLFKVQRIPWKIFLTSSWCPRFTENGRLPLS